MEMGSSSDQYGLADLRQFMAARPLFTAYPPPGEQFPGHRGYYDIMTSLGPPPPDHSVANTNTTTFYDHFRCNSTDRCSNAVTTSTTSNVVNCGGNDGGLEMMEGCNNNVGNNNGRWPRQETLMLLEIRSQLDSKFKEANQKGPLWDEVSRIMAEQHGYQRSGKKCREKFENLYKYYKKTKEGKSGRQDGKHYRFFRQLEALYGDNTSSMSLLLSPEPYVVNAPISNTSSATRFPNCTIQEATLQTHHQKLSESQSISISSEFDTSSSEDDDNNDFNVAMRESNYESLVENNGKLMMEISPSLKRGRRSWKAKIREFIDSQMKKLIDTQEAWLEKMLRTLEQKEQERMVREEEWRKQEEARIDLEHKFWAKERAWFEARDAALMEALKKFTGGKELIRALSSSEEILMRTTVTRHDQENKGDCPNNYSKDQDESEMMKSDSSEEIRWEEDEISSLIQIRSNMKHRFQQEDDDNNGDECFERALWEEVSAKMACLGYDRSLKRCKEKWENINECLRRRPNNKECNYKKRKENVNLSTSCYFPSIGDQEETNFCHDHDQSTSDQLRGPHERSAILHHYHHCGSNNAGNAMQDSCFRYLMHEAATNNLWENYCSSSATTTMKFNKEEN
ncbi:hypothetical protein Sjap_012323 [Stephania japonica]|uniref:Myb-like domain-containing protein n=1 Tax=Stephania japonica TaxID=461633 RepID=A0AAP0IVT7_9MAGN